MESIAASTMPSTKLFLNLTGKILEQYYDLDAIKPEPELQIDWAYFGDEYNLKIRSSSKSIQSTSKKIISATVEYEADEVIQSMLLQKNVPLTEQTRAFDQCIYGAFKMFLNNKLAKEKNQLILLTTESSSKSVPRIEITPVKTSYLNKNKLFLKTNYLHHSRRHLLH